MTPFEMFLTIVVCLLIAWRLFAFGIGCWITARQIARDEELRHNVDELTRKHLDK